MKHIVIAEWDSNNKPVKANEFTSAKKLSAWLAKHGEKYPNAISGKIPEGAKLAHVVVDTASKTLMYSPVALLTAFIEGYRKRVGEQEILFGEILVVGNKSTRSALSETIAFWRELDQAETPATISWQAINGFHDIDLPTLVGLGKVIGFHRQKTFAVKKAILSMIEEGVISTEEEVKAAFTTGMQA